MGALVDSHPRMQELAEEEATLAGARQANKERVAAKVEPYQAERAQWEQDWREAVATGKEPPPEPRAPDLGADEFAEANVFWPEQQRLAAERKRRLAEIRGEIEAHAVQAERAVLTKAQKHAKALVKLAEEERDLLADVRAVRVAEDSQLGGRTTSGCDAYDVLRAALDGTSPVGLAPSTPPVGAVMSEPQQRTPSMRTNLPPSPPLPVAPRSSRGQWI